MNESKIIRPATDDLPELRHLVDVRVDELHQPSGVFDGDRELTNDEYIKVFAQDYLGATDVISNSNGLASEATKEANSKLAKDKSLNSLEKSAAFNVSKIAVMPKK